MSRKRRNPILTALALIFFALIVAVGVFYVLIGAGVRR